MNDEAERRLLAHLEQLRAADLEPAGELPASVVRRARWQRIVRPYLSAAGGMAGAVGDATRLGLANRVRS